VRKTLGEKKAVVVGRREKEVLLVLPTLQEGQASRSKVRVPVRQRALPMMRQPCSYMRTRWLVVGGK
jgi:hypothetical protein